MKNVRIEPGCTTCGSCEFIAPKVFEVTDVAYVRTDADIQANSNEIELAARACPVNVIKYEK